jgi:hypothetical protein
MHAALRRGAARRILRADPNFVEDERWIINLQRCASGWPVMTSVEGEVTVSDSTEYPGIRAALKRIRRYLRSEIREILPSYEPVGSRPAWRRAAGRRALAGNSTYRQARSAARRYAALYARRTRAGGPPKERGMIYRWVVWERRKANHVLNTALNWT